MAYVPIRQHMLTHRGKRTTPITLQSPPEHETEGITLKFNEKVELSAVIRPWLTSRTRAIHNRTICNMTNVTAANQTANNAASANIPATTAEQGQQEARRPGSGCIFNIKESVGVNMTTTCPYEVLSYSCLLLRAE